MQEALENKACLLVLDDVWDLAHAQAFRDTLGPRCRLLLTTRDGGLANKLEAHVWHVDRLKDETARALLAEWAGVAPDSLPPEADEVVRECGNLPFRLAQCGATIRNGNSWHDLLEALRKADLSYFAERQFRTTNIPTSSSRYRSASIFSPNRTKWPRSDTWNWRSFPPNSYQKPRRLRCGARRRYHGATCQEAAYDSPQRRTRRTARGEKSRPPVLVARLQVDYVTAVAADTGELQETLLQAYRRKCRDGWVSGRATADFFQYLPYHLNHGHQDKTQSLLLETRMGAGETNRD